MGQTIRRHARTLGALAAIIAVGGLTACDTTTTLGNTDEDAVEDAGFIQGLGGAVVADDPRVARIGREILEEDGTAGDAIAAMFFAMSVTRPTHVSLGSGGICTVRHHTNSQTFTLDFLSRLPVDQAGKSVGSVPIPGAVRGIALLHARLGIKSLARVIGPAERLARFGFPASRGLVRDVAKNARLARNDRTFRTIFFNLATRRFIVEGDQVVNPDLALTLGILRTRGIGSFYQGEIATAIREAAGQIGGQIAADQQQRVTPAVRGTLQFKWQFATRFAFPIPPGSGGVHAAQLAALLALDDLYEDADEAERPHLLAEATLATYSERRRWRTPEDRSREALEPLVSEDWVDEMTDWLDEDQARARRSLDPSPTAIRANDALGMLVAIDSYGNSAACNFTKDKPFGSGRAVDGYGFYLPAEPGANGATAGAMAPFLVISIVDKRSYMAAAANGGDGAVTDLVKVVMDVLAAEKSIDNAMRAPRTRALVDPPAVAHEPDLSDEAKQELTKRGHALFQTTSGWGHVGMTFCPSGAPIELEKNLGCVVFYDPRGYGLGLTNDRL